MLGQNKVRVKLLTQNLGALPASPVGPPASPWEPRRHPSTISDKKGWDEERALLIGPSFVVKADDGFPHCSAD